MLDNIEITKTMPPPTQEMIDKFNDFYRVFLPQDFISFMNEKNGLVSKDILTFKTSDNEKVIERFLPLLDNPRNYHSDGYYAIGVVIAQVSDRLIDDGDMLGINIIPIAALFAGDLLCLDFRNNNTSPSVVVWYNDLSDELDPCFEYLAPTFSNFLSLLIVNKK
jgi:SMI1-KNR4 cell-wall